MIRTALGLAVLLAIPSAASAQSFRPNDLYLITPAAAPEGGGGGSVRAILRIDPTTWAVEYIAEFNDIQPGRGVHDPYRNQLVINGGTGSLIAADGTRDPLPLTVNADHPASAGDGRLYFFDAHGWAMIDAFNAQHDVVDPDGLPITRLIHASWFDRGRNRIYTAEQGSVVTIRRWDPSPDGTVLEPGPTVATWDVDAGGSDVPVGFSKGPGDTIFLKVDDNTNNTNPRMALLNPDTMTITTFASSGYFGVAGEVAGCYSPAIGKAVVLDSLGDRLRVYSQGDSGPGTIVLECCVSSGGSGELAQIINIDEVVCPADFDGNGTLSIFDFLAFLTAFGNADPAADFDHNGLLNIFDFLAFQTAFGQGC